MIRKIPQLTILSCLILGCDFDSIELDKVKGPTVNPGLSLNLGSIKYSIKELVEDLESESLEVNEDEELLLSIVYSDTTVFDNTEDFILIEDVEDSRDYHPFDTDLPPVPSAQTVSLDTRVFEFEFNPEEGEKIDSTFFKGGTLEVTFLSEFDNVQIDYRLTFDDIRDQASNEPVLFAGRILDGQREDTQSTGLAGLKNIARREGSSNIFEASLDLTFIIPAGTEIAATDGFEIQLFFDDPEFSAIFGDFDNDMVEVQQDSIEIDVFDEFNEGGLMLGSPSVQITVENRFGVEFGLDLSEVVSVNDNGQEVQLSGDIVNNFPFIDAPDNQSLGSSVISQINITTENSNIDDLLNISPNKIVLPLNAELNPPSSSNANNFLLDSSYIEIRSRMEIPLDLNMNGFSRDFDISFSGSDFESADSLTINARVVNDIPFNGTLGLTFIDNDGNELHSIPEINFIESPPIGPDGRTTQTTEINSSIELVGEALDAFLESEEIRATINVFTFGTNEGAFVKIFSDYQLEIYLTAQGKVEVEL